MPHAFSTKSRAAVGSLAAPPGSGETIEALEPIKTLPLEGALAAHDACPRAGGGRGSVTPKWPRLSNGSQD